MDLKILQTYPMPEADLAVLRELGQIKLVHSDDVEVLKREARDAHVIVCGTEPITAEVISAATDLRAIDRFGAGYDNIDVAAATARNIPIFYSPKVNAQTVAEHTVALMLATSCNVARGDRSVRVEGFYMRPRVLGREVGGKTLGVVGFGEIGARVARICQHGLGMQLLVNTAHPDPQRLVDAGVEGRFVDLEELMSESDVVTVHVILQASTEGLISRSLIDRMKPTAFLVNTSRGALLDEQALIDALEEGRIAGAGLDVYTIEPPEPDNPLLQMEKVAITPHIASNSHEAFHRMGVLCHSSTAEFLRGGRPEVVVNPEVYDRL